VLGGAKRKNGRKNQRIIGSGKNFLHKVSTRGARSVEEKKRIAARNEAFKRRTVRFQEVGQKCKRMGIDPSEPTL